MTKAEINDKLKELLVDDKISRSAEESFEELSIAFAELKKESEEKQLQTFINDGGDSVEFTYSVEDDDTTYSDLKTTFEQKLKKQKEAKSDLKSNSLEKRKSIIEELVKITKTDVKNLGKHFRKASELQDQWKKTAHFDTEEFNLLESEYKSNLDKFYHNGQIIKDAIELDYQKNKEAKDKVLIKIRELSSETEVITIEQKVRQYEKEWFRVGPVKKEIRDESKQELQDAIDSLQPTLDKLYESQHELLQANLNKKIHVCEKLNDLLGQDINSPKQYQQASDKVINLQNEWKEIGRSTENDRIWEVFKNACDRFFDSKRDFFKNLADNRSGSKEEKLKLIKQAEGAANSTDWKKTSDFLIGLQKQWKKIGPAHPAEDQKLWVQFRSACDVFFNARSEHYKERDKQYEENLVKKNELITQIKSFELTGNSGKDVAEIQSLEKSFQAIGFVPFKQKDKIHNGFYDVLNGLYEKLNINRKEKAEMRFESKVKSMAHGRKPTKTLNFEQNKIRQRMEEIRQTLAQYENNISFVSGNENNPLVKSIKKSMKDAEREYSNLQMQLDLVKDAKAGKFDEEE